MKDKLYIGELSKKLNISKRTILYYEDIGLIKSVRELNSNYRLYVKEEIIKLQQIILFKKINLPLNEICRIITLKDSEYAVSMFEKQLKKFNNEISNLVYSKGILEAFINITHREGVENIDVIKLLTDLTCVDSKYEKIIGLNDFYEINLELQIGTNLISIADKNSDGSLINRIRELREELKVEKNILLPLIRICDKEELDKDEYAVKLLNCIVDREKIGVDKVKENYEKCLLITNNLKKTIINNIELFDGLAVENDADSMKGNFEK
jgi:DNA-binding transcriptional MerR regulator